MRSFDPPSEYSPERRTSDVASILAVGVLRLRKLGTFATESAQKRRDSSAIPTAGRLEVSDETVLSVHNG